MKLRSKLMRRPIRRLVLSAMTLLFLQGCSGISAGSVDTACRLFHQPFEYHDGQDARTRAWGNAYMSVWLPNCDPETYRKLKEEE